MSKEDLWPRRSVHGWVLFLGIKSVYNDYKQRKWKKLPRNCLGWPVTSYGGADHFTCTSTNVIYCITCTLCKKLYIGETGIRLGDRFREHLRDVEKDDKNASKPVARRFNLPNHSKQHMVVCGLSLHQGSTESRKNLTFKSALLILTVSMNAFHSANLFCCFHVTRHQPIA